MAEDIKDVKLREEQIMKHIDDRLMQKEKEYNQIFEDEYKEKQVANISPSSSPTTSTEELSLLHTEIINTLSSKMDNLLLSLNNNHDKMKSFVTWTQFKNSIISLTKNQKKMQNDDASQNIISEMHKL